MGETCINQAPLQGVGDPEEGSRRGKAGVGETCRGRLSTFSSGTSAQGR